MVQIRFHWQRYAEFEGVLTLWFCHAMTRQISSATIIIADVEAVGQQLAPLGSNLINQSWPSSRHSASAVPTTV